MIVLRGKAFKRQFGHGASGPHEWGFIQDLALLLCPLSDNTATGQHLESEQLSYNWIWFLGIRFPSLQNCTRSCLKSPSLKHPGIAAKMD